jgi:hypothetical protein
MPFAPRARCDKPVKHRLRAGFSAMTFGTVNKGPGMVGTGLVGTGLVGTGLLAAPGCPPPHTSVFGTPRTAKFTLLFGVGSTQRRCAIDDGRNGTPTGDRGI